MEKESDWEDNLVDSKGSEDLEENAAVDVEEDKVDKHMGKGDNREDMDIHKVKEVEGNTLERQGEGTDKEDSNSDNRTAAVVEQVAKVVVDKVIVELHLGADDLEGQRVLIDDGDEEGIRW
jgi:hypothetical protein